MAYKLDNRLQNLQRKANSAIAILKDVFLNPNSEKLVHLFLGKDMGMYDPTDEYDGWDKSESPQLNPLANFTFGIYQVDNQKKRILVWTNN